jgi:hypothetical protein
MLPQGITSTGRVSGRFFMRFWTGPARLRSGQCAAQAVSPRAMAASCSSERT